MIRRVIHTAVLWLALAPCALVVPDLTILALIAALAITH